MPDRSRGISDTSPDAARIYNTAVAGLSPTGRLERARDLARAANELALAGLRRRFPTASEPELLLRLAALRLGPEVVQRAYGWRAPADGA